MRQTNYRFKSVLSSIEFVLSTLLSNFESLSERTSSKWRSIKWHEIAIFFSFFLKSFCLKSVSYEWREKSTRSGSQLVDNLVESFLGNTSYLIYEFHSVEGIKHSLLKCANIKEIHIIYDITALLLSAQITDP